MVRSCIWTNRTANMDNTFMQGFETWAECHRYRISGFNPDYTLESLLRAKMPANSGTSSNFASHRNGDLLSHPLVVHSFKDLQDLRCALAHKTLAHEAKSLWSTWFYWPFDSHYENPMRNPGWTTSYIQLHWICLDFCFFSSMEKKAPRSGLMDNINLQFNSTNNYIDYVFMEWRCWTLNY